MPTGHLRCEIGGFGKDIADTMKATIDLLTTTPYFCASFWHKLEQKESASVRPSEQPPPPQEVSVQPLRLQQRLAVTQILKWWQPEWGAKCSTPLCARVSTNEQGTCNSCYDVTHSTFDLWHLLESGSPSRL